MRNFTTGASRNNDTGKLDPEGALSPIVIQAYCEFIAKNRLQDDGSIRPDDNWQKLFGDDHLGVCMKSLWRHLLDLWLFHRGLKGRETIDDALGGILFNSQAYWYKILKDRSD